MYNPDYINFGPTGWTCPKCGRVYAPSQPTCVYCNSNIIKYLNSTTTAKSEWIYKDNSRTDDIYDNEWWKYPSSISWEDMVRKTGLLEDE